MGINWVTWCFSLCTGEKTAATKHGIVATVPASGTGRGNCVAIRTAARVSYPFFIGSATFYYSLALYGPFLSRAGGFGLVSRALPEPHPHSFHAGGFVFGIPAAIIFLPYITFGKWDRRRKIILISIAVPVLLFMFIGSCSLLQSDIPISPIISQKRRFSLDETSQVPYILFREGMKRNFGCANFNPNDCNIEDLTGCIQYRTRCVTSFNPNYWKTQNDIVNRAGRFFRKAILSRD
jgi:hypothetical protein